MGFIIYFQASKDIFLQCRGLDRADGDDEQKQLYAHVCAWVAEDGADDVDEQAVQGRGAPGELG